MISALVLSLIASATPSDRTRVAVLDIDNRGTKLAPATLANLAEYAGTLLLATGAAEVVTPTHIALRPDAAATVAAVRACAGATCAPELAEKLGAAEVMITRVMAVGRVCAVSAVWWNLETNSTEGAAVREGSCSDEDVLTSLRAAVESASEQGVVSFRLRRDIAEKSACTTTPGVPPGYVTLDTVPTARVKMGDKLLGETPLSKEKLPSGCVELVVETGDGVLQKKVRVQVEPNKVMRYRFSL